MRTTSSQISSQPNPGQTPLTRATNGTIATKFSWDPIGPLPELALERTNANALIRRYVHGPDGPVSFTTTSGTFYDHRDPIGSVRSVSSSTGVEQWKYDYDPFGENRATTKAVTTAPSNPVQFAGEFLDIETNYYHLRARQYDPALGRFLALDPIPAPGSSPFMQSFAYVGNRPLVLVDPRGEKAMSFRDAFDLIALMRYDKLNNLRDKYRARPQTNKKAAPFTQFNWDSNDCSSPGIVKSIVGNFDVVATPPCRQHDFCYRNTYRAYRLTWGNYTTLKNRCDTHFRSEMYNACDDTQDHWVSTAVCKQDARLYYSGVMKFGNLQTSS